MKLIPILFSTPMVEAIINGRKTVTRRTRNLNQINQEPDRYDFIGFEDDFAVFLDTPTGDIKKIKCPFGRPRDIIWVRETWAKVPEGLSKDIGFDLPPYIYKTDHIASAAHSDPWKPSIHMPYEAARIFLAIHDIKVERLQDISEQDAIAEGVELIHPSRRIYRDYVKTDHALVTAYASFKSLWKSIHSAESWDASPWVWAVYFSPTSKPKSKC